MAALMTGSNHTVIPEEPKTILVSELAWQEVQGGIRALRMDYEALAKETREVKAKYEALLLKESTP